MGGMHDLLGKRYAVMPGERWSPPPGEEGGAQSVLPRQSRQTVRFPTAQPDYMLERIVIYSHCISIVAITRD